MRVLFLSNLYPPHHMGGYELACREAADALAARGHDVAVLTSMYGLSAPRVDGNVHRWLTSEWDRKSRRLPFYVAHAFRQERQNRRAFRELVDRFRPELLYVWNPANISLSLVILAEQAGLPIAFYVFDEWMTRWSAHQSWLNLWAPRPRRRLARYLRPMLRRAARAAELPTFEEYGRGERRLAYRHAQFASQYLLDAARAVTGAEPAAWRILPWGVDAERFSAKPAGGRPRRRLLFVGQVMRHKGVHTAVEAVRLLRDVMGYRDTTLDVVGGSTAPRYVSGLQRAIRSAGLEAAVRLCGPVERDTLARLYAEHDVLIFPSAWNEPFGITILEAMACGLPVVGTGTGGSVEILRSEVNALIFDREDAHACAQQVGRLFADGELYDRLRAGGRQTVLERFTIRQTIDAIERALEEALAR